MFSIYCIFVILLSQHVYVPDKRNESSFDCWKRNGIRSCLYEVMRRSRTSEKYPACMYLQGIILIKMKGSVSTATELQLISAFYFLMCLVFVPQSFHIEVCYEVMMLHITHCWRGSDNVAKTDNFLNVYKVYTTRLLLLYCVRRRKRNWKVVANISNIR